MVTVCSRPEGRLLAVPTSRYSYPDVGFGDTCVPHPAFRYRRGYLLRGIGDSRYCPISRAVRPPRMLIDTMTNYVKHPFNTSNVVCGRLVGFIPALKGGAFSLNQVNSGRRWRAFSRSRNSVYLLLGTRAQRSRRVEHARVIAGIPLGCSNLEVSSHPRSALRRGRWRTRCYRGRW